MWKALSGALIIAIVLTAPASAKAASVSFDFGPTPFTGQEEISPQRTIAAAAWDRGGAGSSGLSSQLFIGGLLQNTRGSANDDAGSAAPQVSSVPPRTTPKKHRHLVRNLVVVFALGAALYVLLALGAK